MARNCASSKLSPKRLRALASITGGTIKLTREMRDREHTRQELDKLGNYKIILNGYSVYDEESLKEYINTI